MVIIKDLKEKELLIAFFFYRRKSMKLTKESMYNTWIQWFHKYEDDDFKIGKHKVFTVEDDKLAFRQKVKNVKRRDPKILAEYDDKFQRVYLQVKHYVETYNNDMFVEAIEKEQNKNYQRILGYIRENNIPVKLCSKMDNDFTNKRFNQLKRYTVYHNDEIVASGSCDHVLMKLEKKYGFKKP